MIMLLRRLVHKNKYLLNMGGTLLQEKQNQISVIHCEYGDSQKYILAKFNQQIYNKSIQINKTFPKIHRKRLIRRVFKIPVVYCLKSFYTMTLLNSMATPTEAVLDLLKLCKIVNLFVN